MSYHNNAPFSAKDVDHDTNSGNCAVDYLTAWWNLSCLRIKLTATYASSGYNVMGWHGWESYKPLKVARMLIRHQMDYFFNFFTEKFELENSTILRVSYLSDLDKYSIYLNLYIYVDISKLYSSEIFF